MKGFLRRIVPQSRLGRLHGTDGAEYVTVDLFGCIRQFQSVQGLTRNIIILSCQQDKEIIYILKMLYDPVIEGT